MDRSIWAVMHGGTTHFPIALVMASALFDLTGLLVSDRAEGRSASLRAAGYYTLVLAAVGAMGAVFSGLMMTHWAIAGSGALARHHAYLWPAFGLLTGLAAW